MLPWILGLKALGLRSRMASTAACLVASFSRLLQQVMQLQWSQYRPLAKHSQYSFRQRLFLQLQCLDSLLLAAPGADRAAERCLPAAVLRLCLHVPIPEAPAGSCMHACSVCTVFFI